jgi:hypothetical protein
MAKSSKREKLKSISDIRRFFHRNETPIYFVSPTNFNLHGMDEWVRNFKFISYIDCYDRRHPNVFVPRETAHEQFEGMEDVNNYLLRHPDVREFMRANGRNSKAVFLMFNKETERLAKAAGLKVWFPSASLRERVDNKIETVRIGDRAGVPSVPNVLARVGSYDELRKLTRKLGLDLVVQTAFGDSGHTTFFISNDADWKRHSAEITGAGEVKIMKRIRCRGVAIEACATRHGTVVGPLMTELVGFKELTPYKGGWCGNEIFAECFTPQIRRNARDFAQRFGAELLKMGYRGYFELDVLVDEDSGKLYLGEVNPRITGASSMTNQAAFAHADLPLFLLHLLEFSGVDFDVDLEELNSRWADPRNIDSWSQMVIKHTEDSVDRIAEAPMTGIWRMADDGRIAYSRFDYHRRAIVGEQEAFFLRIVGPGAYRYEGADLGILVTRGRLMSNRFQLNRRAHDWLNGIKREFRPLAGQNATMGRGPAGAELPVSLPWSWFSGGGVQGLRSVP